MTCSRLLGWIGIALALAGCHRRGGNPAPPRVIAPIAFPQQTSTIVVPISTGLDTLARGLDEETPRTLYRIDEHKPDCVAAKRVDIGIAKLKVTPKLGCHIVGQVTRGALALGGSGERLTIAMPVRATIAVRDVGGIVSKTVTGDAVVHAVARLSIVGDWQLAAKVAIDYDWTDAPGIDLLGQRITFAGKADEKLKPVLAQLERDLPHQLAKLQLRRQLAGVWRQGFTSIELNGDNPPAWMRVTPQTLGVGSYRVEGRQLRLTLSADALTETFVGDRPPDPVPTPLPPPARVAAQPGLRFFIPVLADYRQLEPVIERALGKLARKSITLKGIGPVEAKFGKVTVYATTGNRLAIGVRASVHRKGSSFISTKGQVWLSALPYNEAGSQIVRARDLQFATSTDSRVVDLLVPLFNDTSVRESIREGLTQDFGKDYAKLLAKAQAAIGARREGDFILSAQVTQVRNGTIRATGAGLFLPVQAEGAATIVYRPR